jgi:hypothetical protein
MPTNSTQMEKWMNAFSGGNPGNGQPQKGTFPSDFLELVPLNLTLVLLCQPISSNSSFLPNHYVPSSSHSFLQQPNPNDFPQKSPSSSFPFMSHFNTNFRAPYFPTPSTVI